MNETSNPFALSPDDVAAWQAGKKTNSATNNRPSARSSSSDFAQFHYETLLALAAKTRDALLAVLTILHHRQFKNWNKAAPITLGNRRLRALGFHHTDKIRALKELSDAGWITVRWCDRKSPQVTFIKGFKF